MKNLITGLLLLFTFLASPSVWAATTYYIRSDGGTATQCDGTHDHALAGATGTQCGLNSPYWVLVLQGDGNSSAKQAVGGDTIVIDGSDQGGTGSFRIGCQNASTCADSSINLLRGAACNEFQSYDCVLGTIPSGTASANTKVIGCTSTGCGCSSALVSGNWVTTCTHPRPELWGAGNIWQVLNITGSSNITIQDLEITDHASIGQGHPTLSGGGSGNFPSRLDAKDGIRIMNSNDITFKNLNVHGLWRDGMFGGSVGNHTYDNVTIAYNASAGIDYDNCGNDGTCGVTSGKTMTYKNGTTIKYNGCIENASSIGNPMTQGCFDQNAGGYGDGIGGTNSSGTWTVTDSDFSHNTSDGLDLLYLNRSGKSGGTLSIKRSRFEGNVGDQVKSDNNVTIEDSYIIGNCGYYSGQTFTQSALSVCRGGSTVTIASNVNSGTTTAKYYNNTITSNSDVMFSTGDASGNCSAAFTVDVRNNLLLGGKDATPGQTDQTAAMYVGEGTCTGLSTYSEDYNTCSNNFKDASPCPASHSKNNIASSSTYAGTISQGPTYYTGANYINELTLKSTSTAIGAALTTISGTDSLGFGSQDRGVVWDMGAKDYAAGTSPVCGNSAIESGETCDDGNAVSGDGCSSVCATESGYSCVGSPSVCTTVCGDGIITGSEACDDSNTTSGDGCKNDCTAVETGFTCSGTPSTCSGICGDGLIKGSEGCDDHNTTNGDGCNSSCAVESGYTCTGTPSTCTKSSGSPVKLNFTGTLNCSGVLKSQ